MLLNELSKELGDVILLVQASGGNVSLKDKDTLKVKASGLWLSDALDKNIFVSLNLNALREAIHKKKALEDLSLYQIEGFPLRPSIEATLHALLPHRVIVHVHAINVLSYAVKKNGYIELSEKLSDFRWAWVPYVRPGVPLTYAVQEILADKPDVVILQNHGIIVGADTCDAVAKRLNAVEKCLNVVPRVVNATPTKALLELASESNAVVPNFSDVQGLALDPLSFDLATKGALYPDQVVFLGEKLCAMETIQEARTKTSFSPYWIIKDQGVLVFPEKSKKTTVDMLRGHAALLARLNKAELLRFLTPVEVGDLVKWDAEKYRQSLKQ